MHENLILEMDINVTLFGNLEESKEYLDPTNVSESYRGWNIVLYIPNGDGGILGFDIIGEAYDIWMGEGTSVTFDYHDKIGIINYAKSVIDKIEEMIATCNGQQLSLFI